MFFEKKVKALLIASLFTLVLIPMTVFSNMQSTNYKIQFDSLNIGGSFSTSTNYGLDDTVGEVATGNSTSTNFEMRAGYQQMNSGYIAISNQSLVDIGNMPGIVTANAGEDTTVNVVTDSFGGYQLTVRASTSPALQSPPYYFEDYIPASVDPDFDFIIPATKSVFGYSVSGQNVIQKFKNNGSACNAGATSTPEKCWVGLSTTPSVVSERYSANHPTGTDTIFYYKAGIGTDKIQEAGAYQADIIITAITL